MSLDISVPGGNPDKPGFSVQRSANGLSISAGALADSPAMFGVMNDEGGLSMNVYPLLGRAYGNVMVRVSCAASAYLELSGAITLEVLNEDAVVIETICTQAPWTWAFMPTLDSWQDLGNGNWLYWPGLYPPVENLAVGSPPRPSHCRLTVYWGSYSAGGYASARAVDVHDFDVPEALPGLAWVSFAKHESTTNEW